MLNAGQALEKMLDGRA